MGNIKTSFVKRVGKTVFNQHSDVFTEDFSKNKELIKGFVDIKSKKLRNFISGYVTNLKKQSNSGS